MDSFQGAKVADLTKKVKELSDHVKLRAKTNPVASAAAAAVKSDAKDLSARLKELTSAAPAMLFMKGSPGAPECGFSKTTVAMLASLNAEFGYFDILGDNEVRQGLKVKKLNQMIGTVRDYYIKL